MATARELQEMANEILENAKENGVESNYLFVTTFERYETQLKVLEKLRETINAAGEILVTKEYIKGKENLYTNPAVTEFNRTTDSANKTVSTLMKIIKNFSDRKSDEPDPLLEKLNGGDLGE